MTDYQTAYEIEFAVAHHFGTRTHTIVPNVSWGMFAYELDLCILNNRSFYADEVEIKVSKSDLKRDSLKKHRHSWNSNMIRRLWFAMPERMENCTDLVPEHAGILLVSPLLGAVTVLRAPAVNKAAKKWRAEDAFKLARLGTLRMWTLKQKLWIKKVHTPSEAQHEE